MRKLLALLVLGVLLAGAVGCNGNPITPDSNVPTLDAAPTNAPTEEATEETTTEEATTEASTTEPLPTAVPGELACVLTPPIAQPLSGLPPITDQDWVRGNPNAEVVLVEYADFQ